MKRMLTACLTLGLMLTTAPLGMAQHEAITPNDGAQNEAVTERIPTPERIAEGEGYAIIRQDISYREESTGLPLISIYYDQLVLTEDSEAARQVNAQMEAECQAFLRRYPPEEYEYYLTDPWISTEYCYQNNAAADVVWNQAGLLSIRMTYDWYMGGVFNQDFGGMTFDLRTGNRVAIADLVSMPEEELLAYLREAVKVQAIREGRQFLTPEEAALEQYATTDSFPFYIEDGEIVVCLPTYEMGAGVDGPLLVDTGLMV